jgi:hypothetical protein
MAKFFSTLISKISPVRFLPTAKKCVVDCSSNTSAVLNFNTTERRDLLRNTIDSYIDGFLNKYSPIRYVKNAFNVFRQKIVLVFFHHIIGEMALAHAAIEQELKNELLYRWDIPETIKLRMGKTVSISKISGFKLREVFLDVLSERLLPDMFWQQYDVVLKEFSSASNDRNEALKAIYLYHVNEGKMTKFNPRLFHPTSFATRADPLVYMRELTKPVDLAALTNLRNNLFKIRAKVTAISGQVFADKMTVIGSFSKGAGSIVPDFAFKNPYVYQEILRRKSV